MALRLLSQTIQTLQSLQIVKYTLKPVATQAIHRGARVLNKNLHSHRLVSNNALELQNLVNGASEPINPKKKT